MIKKLNDQEEQLKHSYKQIEELTTEVKSLKNKNFELQIKCEDLEQYTRRNYIEILGITESKNENLFTIIEKIGKSLDYPINSNMIDVCHRIKLKNKKESRSPILVRFVRAADK